MRIKGYSAFEVVVALFLWSFFLMILRSQLISQHESEKMYHQTLHHYHVIENIMYLDYLGVLYKSTYGFNEKGMIDLNGVYKMIKSNGVVKIYYFEVEIYAYETS